MARASDGIDCSVVVVSFRTGPVLIQCLRSILAQDGLAELILVNNGNDRPLMREVRALAEADQRLRILEGHGNVGFARGCNLGAREAAGRYLLLLNPDCILPPATLSRAMRVFGRRSDCRLLTVSLVNPDGSQQRGSRRNLPTPWICLVETLRLDRLAPNHPHFTRLNLHEASPPTEITPVQCISGAFMMMPLAFYRGLGGLDEAYFLHVEDIDFCMAVGRSGGTILFDPHIAVVHVKGTSRAFPLWTEWHKSRGFIRYFHKHFSDAYPPLLLRVISGAVLTRLLLRSVPLTARWLLARMVRPQAVAPAQPMAEPPRGAALSVVTGGAPKTADAAKAAIKRAG